MLLLYPGVPHGDTPKPRLRNIVKEYSVEITSKIYEIFRPDGSPPNTSTMGSFGGISKTEKFELHPSLERGLIYLLPPVLDVESGRRIGESLFVGAVGLLIHVNF